MRWLISRERQARARVWRGEIWVNEEEKRENNGTLR